jgi:hypothetical protein
MYQHTNDTFRGITWFGDGDIPIDSDTSQSFVADLSNSHDIQYYAMLQYRVTSAPLPGDATITVPNLTSFSNVNIIGNITDMSPHGTAAAQEMVIMNLPFTDDGYITHVHYVLSKSGTTDGTTWIVSSYDKISEQPHVSVPNALSYSMKRDNSSFMQNVDDTRGFINTYELSIPLRVYRGQYVGMYTPNGILNYEIYEWADAKIFEDHYDNPDYTDPNQRGDLMFNNSHGRGFDTDEYHSFHRYNNEEMSYMRLAFTFETP